MLEWVQGAGVWLLYGGVWVLCLGGIALSCIALSGTWLVALATLIAVPLSGAEFPGWWTFGIFMALCVVIEILEAVAGTWGVARRGGSGLAGFAAFFGGIVGLFLGGLIPIPLVGSLIGMLICSFAATYFVEVRRLAHSGQASHIARGALLARVLAILMKVTASLGMSAVLLFGVLFW